MRCRVSVLFVGIFAYVGTVSAQDGDLVCGQCDRSSCPEPGACPGGRVLDLCGCCLMCARGLGQRCDMNPNIKKEYGPCGEYLQCALRTDIGNNKEATCKCETEGEVCGSDGLTYETLCHLLEKTSTNPSLSIVSRETCQSVPVIKSPPKDAVRPYGSIMVLDCEAAGFPVPEISFELNRPDGSSFKLPSDNSGFAVQVRGGPERHMVTGWVQIMRINDETIGTYTCVATNSKGEARASAKITLQGSGENEASENEI
ncbi:Kazal-type serine protease inhibitor domain [Halocaridina rubra]|uniref:Kazal-type serine protease inhibitor domain n=1 Tax=Halocaridina rubra TaxID=373956 RepID=A0AAN8XB02_HALRR